MSFALRRLVAARSSVGNVTTCRVLTHFHSSQRLSSTLPTRPTKRSRERVDNTTNNNVLLQKQTNAPKRKERLDVAIVGAPNAGKSQLLNQLCGSTIAAVSRKRHTTRSGILGARTVNNEQQLVFVDTPGFMRYKSARKEGLTRDLMTSAESEMTDVDYTLVVIDSARKLDDDLKESLVTLMLKAAASEGRIEATMGLEDEDDAIATDTDDGERRTEDTSAIKQEVVREKFAIVLNKVDLVEPKERLLEIAAVVGEMGDECVRYIERECPTYVDDREFDGDDEPSLQEPDPVVLERLLPPVFYISALKNDGVDDVLAHLLSLTTPCKEWPVPADAAALMSPQERVEEVIREKIYRCLHREVPHQVKQVNRIFRPMTNPQTGEKVIRIDQDLIVRTESHRRLVAGKGGMTLQRMENDAQRDLMKAFDCDVQLNLHVKFTKSQHERNVDSERSGITSRSF
mmetsp:Transcript_22612/g.65087  ORF Transcript_22612/g.65087 Transcript_22612/m.65087 type:complete len:458 (+) Transcript_22612:31-1404(+)